MPPCEPGPRVRGAGGVEIATYHLGGDGPPVMLLHATGFHGRCWLPLAPALADHFSVWSIDQRGHGASGKAPTRTRTGRVFVDDLFAVLDALGLATTGAAIGHSMGGAVLLLAEQRQPGTFRRPVLLRAGRHAADAATDGFERPDLDERPGSQAPSPVRVAPGGPGQLRSPSRR